MVFEAAAQDLVKDEQIQNQAVNNDEATFRDQVFAERYLKALLERLDRNSDVVYAYLDNNQMQSEVAAVYAPEVQKRASSPASRPAP